MPRTRAQRVREPRFPGLATVALAGCSGPASTLAPAGPAAHEIASLSWLLFAVGAAVYALVLGLLVGALVSSLLLVAIGWREWAPQLRFRWRDARGYLDFGLYQMGERTVNYAGANVDYLIIGRFLGPVALGTYSIAYQLIVKPLSVINPMVMRVAFPVFASRQGDDATLRRGYLHVVRLLAYVTMPLLFGLAVVADEFVRVVLGEKWEASAPVLQVMCAVGVLKCLTNPVGSVLLAKDRPDLGFKGNLLALGVMSAALLMAVNDGILAVAWAYLGVTVLMCLGWLLVLGRVIGLRLGDYAGSLQAPFAFSLIMAGAMFVLHLAAADAAPAPEFTLGGIVTAGALVYAGLLATFDASYVRVLWRLFRGRDPVAGD